VGYKRSTSANRSIRWSQGRDAEVGAVGGKWLVDLLRLRMEMIYLQQHNCAAQYRVDMTWHGEV
jgi:hypothetical protein